MLTWTKRVLWCCALTWQERLWWLDASVHWNQICRSPWWMTPKRHSKCKTHAVHDKNCALMCQCWCCCLAVLHALQKGAHLSIYGCKAQKCNHCQQLISVCGVWFVVQKLLQSSRQITCCYIAWAIGICNQLGTLRHKHREDFFAKTNWSHYNITPSDACLQTKFAWFASQIAAHYKKLQVLAHLNLPVNLLAKP